MQRKLKQLLLAGSTARFLFKSYLGVLFLKEVEKQTRKKVQPTLYRTSVTTKQT